MIFEYISEGYPLGIKGILKIKTTPGQFKK
jgi:hypothetical protein